MSATKPQATYSKGILYQINVKDLQADPSQPRKYFDPAAQEDLVNSLQKQGVLQPILFRAGEDGALLVVAGERRLQAAKEAGLETIPAILVEGNYAEIALVENLLRQDLTAIEVAEALNQIMKEHGYNQEQITTIIGKSKSTVSEILSLTRLPDEIRNECRNDPSASRKALIAIAKKKQPRGMLTAYKKYKERRLSVQKPRGPKNKRRTWQDRFVSKHDALTKIVTDVDLETLDAPTRNDMMTRITELKRTATNLLAKIKAAEVKETMAAGKPVQKMANLHEKKPALAQAAPKKATKAAADGKPTTMMLDIG